MIDFPIAHPGSGEMKFQIKSQKLWYSGVFTAPKIFKMGSFILEGVLHLIPPPRHTADQFCPAEPNKEYVRPYPRPCSGELARVLGNFP